MTAAGAVSPSGEMVEATAAEVPMAEAAAVVVMEAVVMEAVAAAAATNIPLPKLFS